MKTIGSLLRIVILVTLSAGALAAGAQTAATISATGYLTDTMCGAKGATAKHIECAKRNVAMGKAQYAIYDESSRRLYILDVTNPSSLATVQQHLGQRVRITGTVSATPITRAGQAVVPDTEGGVNPAPTPNTQMRVVTHTKALDNSTPVAGVLTISSLEAAPR